MRKQKWFQTTQTTTKWYTRLACGAQLLSRRILRGVVSPTLRAQIGRPETKEQTSRNLNMKTKPQATNRHWSLYIIIDVVHHKKSNVKYVCERTSVIS